VILQVDEFFFPYKKVTPLLKYGDERFIIDHGSVRRKDGKYRFSQNPLTPPCNVQMYGVVYLKITIEPPENVMETLLEIQYTITEQLYFLYR